MARDSDVNRGREAQAAELAMASTLSAPTFGPHVAPSSPTGTGALSRAPNVTQEGGTAGHPSARVHFMTKPASELVAWPVT